jgi:hypothetical protein
VRVEAGQHAVDGALDQLVVLHRLDVGGADALEHLAEQVQLLIGAGFGLRRLLGAGGLRRDQVRAKGEGTDRHAADQCGGG